MHHQQQLPLNSKNMKRTQPPTQGHQHSVRRPTAVSYLPMVQPTQVYQQMYFQPSNNQQFVPQQQTAVPYHQLAQPTKGYQQTYNNQTYNQQSNNQLRQVAVQHQPVSTQGNNMGIQRVFDQRQATYRCNLAIDDRWQLESETGDLFNHTYNVHSQIGQGFEGTVFSGTLKKIKLFTKT